MFRIPTRYVEKLTMAKYTQEQLEHYLAHPDEVDATDTDLVDALSGIERTILGVPGDDEGKKSAVDPDAADVAAAKAEAEKKLEEERRATEGAKADAKAKADADAKAAAAKDGDKSKEGQEGDRILTPDGKRTIPYKVLKDERAGREAAETALADAQSTILTLSDRLKALEAGKTDPGAKDGEKTADELEAMLAEIDENAPWLGNLKILVDRVRAAEAKLAAIDTEREETEAEMHDRLQQEANDAITANPTLVLWKSEAPELYAEAGAFDRMLRTNPAQAARFNTFGERFERVVELVKASHAGETIPLPEDVDSSPPSSKTSQQPSAADIKARAAAALKKAEGASITTLSDIPGGSGEVGTEEALSRMDVSQIADKFANMKSVQDILNWVATH